MHTKSMCINYTISLKSIYNKKNKIKLITKKFYFCSETKYDRYIL